MSQSARVLSLETIAEFREALCQFRLDAAKALDAATGDIRRAFDWLQDQQKFWKGTVRLCEEELLRAKRELEQRKLARMDDHGPGYTEQEQAFRKAQARLRHAEEKAEHCRCWIRALPREVIDCEGQIQRLAGMLDAELRQGVAVLDRKQASLEAYVHLAPPSAPAPEVPAEEAAPPAPATNQSQGHEPEHRLD
jgi:hypothetical protein